MSVDSVASECIVVLAAIGMKREERERCETVSTRDGAAARFVIGGGEAKMKARKTEREEKLGFDCLPLTWSGESVFRQVR